MASAPLLLRAPMLVHATAVAIDGRAVLIEGASGSGKSGLALRLIDRGATLIADDAVLLERKDADVLAAAPDTIAGRIEVRGVGIVTLPAVRDVPVALIVTLGDAPERLPPPATRDIAGVDIPTIALDPRPACAAIRVELALRHPEARIA